MNKEYEKVFTDRGFTNIEQMATMFDYYQEEAQRLNTILNNIHTYIEKMSYCEIVDNPKKELSRILERENQ